MKSVYLHHFLSGAAHFPRGFTFLARRPRLWGWVALPLVILVTVFTAFVIAAAAVIPWSIHQLWQSADGAGWWLRLALEGLLVFAATAATAVALWALSSALASPFHDMLALRVEQEVIGREDPAIPWSIVLGDAARSIAHTLIALSIYAVVMAPLFVVGLVPVIGPVISGVLGAIATCTFVAREILDYPLARRRLAFTAKIGFLRTHLGHFQGLGAVTALLLLIPGVNLLVMPVAIVGGTILFCGIQQQHGGADDHAPVALL
jgi:CysZ protein